MDCRGSPSSSSRRKWISSGTHILYYVYIYWSDASYVLGHQSIALNKNTNYSWVAFSQLFLTQQPENILVNIMRIPWMSASHMNDHRSRRPPPTSPSIHSEWICFAKIVMEYCLPGKVQKCSTCRTYERVFFFSLFLLKYLCCCAAAQPTTCLRTTV